jgi:hypothetical protein
MDKRNSRFVNTDQMGWVRDTESGAIICIDQDAKKQHLEEVKRQRAKNDELNNLKDELSQLKKLVNKLIEDK